MSATQKESLLPCPHCGSTDIRVDDIMFSDDDGEHAGVECLTCDAIARYERWNQRTGPRIEVTDEMAMAFHHAETDGAIGDSELDEIKVGLRAALANVCAYQQLLQSLEGEQAEYTQGICGDGAAILKDGQPMSIEKILSELRCTPQPPACLLYTSDAADE